jgi:hypothetical protein
MPADFDVNQIAGLEPQIAAPGKAVCLSHVQAEKGKPT